MTLLLALLACGEEPADYEAWAMNPDEACRRAVMVDGPPQGGCDDVVVTHMAGDGTCWRFGCMWDGMPYDEETGGSGPPDDPLWCSDSDWFSAQPLCE